MKKVIHLGLLSLLVVFWIIGCGIDRPYKEITYNQLPADVKDKFQKVYNYWEPYNNGVDEKGDTIGSYMAPFAECYDLDATCNCHIESKGGILRQIFTGSPYFVVTSCDKKTKISWSVLERVFIIKNDSIYYPFPYSKEYPYGTGGAITAGEPRSYNIKIDTVQFRAEKMN